MENKTLPKEYEKELDDLIDFFFNTTMPVEKFADELNLMQKRYKNNDQK